MAPMDRGRIALTDGTTLSYLEGGSGPTLVMLPGWSQTAEQYKHQLDVLSDHFTVFAVDLRGHGDSDKVGGGYRVARLATDLRELIYSRDLRDIILLGHSMGSSVIWAYIDHYGTDRIAKLVIVDQAPCVTGKPGWSDEEKLSYGCLFPDAAALAGFVDAVRTTDSVEGTKEIIRGMFTSGIDEDELTWIAEMNLRLPREQAADLLWDHCLNDWRDVIASIRVPTLVIGSEASIFSAESQRWIADQNPNAEVEIFEATDGGSHFMFAENPERFNRVVLNFLLPEETAAP